MYVAIPLIILKAHMNISSIINVKILVDFK